MRERTQCRRASSYETLTAGRGSRGQEWLRSGSFQCLLLLTHCVDLFKNCWMRLWKLARRFEDKEVNESLLTHLVDTGLHRVQRQQSLRTAARKSAGKLKRPAANSTAQALGNTRKISPAPQNSVTVTPQEASAEQLMASHALLFPVPRPGDDDRWQG
jgi:hypothetical protein